MNKLMYKLELLSVKYIPILIAFVVLLNAILSFADIYLGILNSIAGTSVLTLIPMYTSSYDFKFCEYHRMFIHYILSHKILVAFDVYIGIPVSDYNLFVINLTIAGIFAFFILYLHQKCKHVTNNKEPLVKNS